MKTILTDLTEKHRGWGHIGPTLTEIAGAQLFLEELHENDTDNGGSFCCISVSFSMIATHSYAWPHGGASSKYHWLPAEPIQGSLLLSITSIIQAKPDMPHLTRLPVNCSSGIAQVTS